MPLLNQHRMVSIQTFYIDSQNCNWSMQKDVRGIGSCSDITSIKSGMRSISKWLIQLEQEYWMYIVVRTVKYEIWGSQGSEYWLVKFRICNKVCAGIAEHKCCAYSRTACWNMRPSASSRAVCWYIRGILLKVELSADLAEEFCSK